MKDEEQQSLFGSGDVVDKELENFKDLADMFCDNCASVPDGYCPTYCCMISRMQRVPFQNLKRSYIRNEGDIRAVLRYAIEWERNHEEKQE